jgi:hypothetical protein
LEEKQEGGASHVWDTTERRGWKLEEEATTRQQKSGIEEVWAQGSEEELTSTAF